MNEAVLEREYRKTVKALSRVIPGETSNYQLNKIGKQLFKGRFLGSFPCDSVRRVLPNKSCIINLDGSTERGSHWTAIARSHDGKLFFYDSFGRSWKNIIPILKRWFPGENIYCDTKDREQDETQTDCGSRCLSWLSIFYKHGPIAALKI